MRLAQICPVLILLGPLAVLSLSPASAGQDLEALPGDSGASPSPPNVTYFGGTFWNADSMRWEALKDSVWTFDSGVGSHFDHSQPFVQPKDPSLHALMEGWIGYSPNSPGYLGNFRRLTDGDFSASPDVCVGTAAGLGGTASFWAGVLQQEADSLGFVSGQGYGNLWNIELQKSFAYPGSGTVTLEFDYFNDTEPFFDLTYVLVDTTGSGADVEIASYTGISSGHASLTLSPSVNLPTSAGSITIRFRVTSDGVWSDEDGLYATACGAFGVDNIQLTGAINEGPATFESDDEGWSVGIGSPTVYADWSNIVDISSLPPVQVSPCALEDSVLVFEDLGVPEAHGPYQYSLAISPWIDLKAEGLVGAPGKLIEFDLYWEQQPPPTQALVYAVLSVQWDPCISPQTGLVHLSPITGSVGGDFGNVTQCDRQSIDLSSMFPIEAEQIRVLIGVYAPCPLHLSCTGFNSTPWFDNIRFGVYGDPVPLPSELETAPQFISSWGSTGSGEGQFDVPYGIALDDEGNVYVTDARNDRVQKFTESGQFITAWGDSGSGPGQFWSPYGITVGPSGHVYVTDGRNQRIQKFTSDGAFVTAWGSAGTGDGQFSTPLGIAVDSFGYVYVVDAGNDRVQWFTSDGTFLGVLGDGELVSPSQLAFGPDGLLYVTDFTRIKVFRRGGELVRSWGFSGSSCQGQFRVIMGIAIDSDGMVYLTDGSPGPPPDNQRIQKYTNFGAFLSTWGTLGSGDGQFEAIGRLAVRPGGDKVYVTDFRLDRVTMFSYSSVGTPDAGGFAELTAGHPYPNPTLSAARFSLELPTPEAGGKAHYIVRAEIFDLAGRLVRVLYEGQLPPGEHSMAWDGMSRSGVQVGAGVYFVRVQVDNRTVSTNKIVRLR